MSDNDSSTKGPGGKVAAAWTDHEVLVYLFSAMEYSKFIPDYSKAPVPVGRNASGIRQKITKLKNALRPDIDALKAGQPLTVDVTTDGATKKGAGERKRKATDDSSAEGTEKKRGRKKKADVEREAELSDGGVQFEMKIKAEEGTCDDEV